MIKRYPIYDGGLGSVPTEYTVYNPTGYNGTGWVPPEISGGGSIGVTGWHEPDIVTVNGSPANEAGIDLTEMALVPAPPVPVKVLPPSAQTDAGDSLFEGNTVLIGAAVIFAAILLLRK